ncbi:MAG: PIN domain-containing protein [Aliifodinibius sp.]|nr:type II toxin-antitoxin system VapC family toxin [Fodinibius sp.]NIV10199.1 PIN domain-containing protein [Fodinibius sp.]NIY23819.1 PIN domain-containing protein [Fodinibius sp.]
MKTFFDSSAFAKRFVEEEGSEIVEEICLNTTSLALSIICVPEIISALNRRLREENIDQGHYHIAKTRILEEIEDIIILNITPAVISKSTEMLENNILKAMDALHLACAIEWEPDLFVSSDIRQTEAAQKAGLQTRFIESP